MTESVVNEKKPRKHQAWHFNAKLYFLFRNVTGEWLQSKQWRFLLVFAAIEGFYRENGIAIGIGLRCVFGTGRGNAIGELSVSWSSASQTVAKNAHKSSQAQPTQLLGGWGRGS